ALTRARHRTSIVWGGIRGFETSPLGYLLHWPRGKAVPRGNVDAISHELKKLDDRAMLVELSALAAAGEGAIDLIEIDPERRAPKLDLRPAHAAVLEA